MINDTDLVIVPKKAGKVPLDFDIHDLVLKSVGPDKPFDFHGNLTNAKPQGEIATVGTFGPWDADEPGDTAVTGSYKFTDADLGPFPGIAGTLSSTGDYTGQLNEIAGRTEKRTRRIFHSIQWGIRCRCTRSFQRPWMARTAIRICIR